MEIENIKVANYLNYKLLVISKEGSMKKIFNIKPFVNKRNNQSTIVLSRKQLNIPKGKTLKSINLEIKKIKWK